MCRYCKLREHPKRIVPSEQIIGSANMSSGELSESALKIAESDADLKDSFIVSSFAGNKSSDSVICGSEETLGHGSPCHERFHIRNSLCSASEIIAPLATCSEKIDSKINTVDDMTETMFKPHSMKSTLSSSSEIIVSTCSEKLHGRFDTADVPTITMSKRAHNFRTGLLIHEEAIRANPSRNVICNDTDLIQTSNEPNRLPSAEVWDALLQ
jgi:hypothetical protein